MPARATSAYWSEYSHLQKVKHDLIREYLNGWFPKLGSWAGRIVYLDTHAGRGRHASGHLGSPLVALTTLLAHSSRDRILANSEARFYFVEHDADNAAALAAEVAALGPLPRNLFVESEVGDAFELVSSVVRDMKSRNEGLAPAFIFVDPFGFKVPNALLTELMEFPRVELFVNVIWRELDMAIKLGQKDSTPGMVKTLDLVFGGELWRDITSNDFDERAAHAVELLRFGTKARWATYVRMLGDNNATRYLLLHLTNHDAGRDLMKDCIWKVCPEGGFYARKRDNDRQEMLLRLDPDLAPLRSWTIDYLRTRGPQRWSHLTEAIRPEIWRQVHLNDAIRALRASGAIVASGYSGRFAQKVDPVLASVGGS